jgi:hypothetical protein
MTDTADAREDWRHLAARLEGQPRWPELNAAYLELAPLVGRLQGLVGEARRAHGETDEVREAEQALERLKASARRVGLDIRLASEPALLIGLQTALQDAAKTLDRLEAIGS